MTPATLSFSHHSTAKNILGHGVIIVGPVVGCACSRHAVPVIGDHTEPIVVIGIVVVPIGHHVAMVPRRRITHDHVVPFILISIVAWGRFIGIWRDIMDISQQWQIFVPQEDILAKAINSSSVERRFPAQDANALIQKQIYCLQ